MPGFTKDLENRSYGPSVAAHLVLTASSLWSLKDLGFELGFCSIALILYIAAGVSGTLLYGFGCGGPTFYKVYNNLWLWSLSLGLPLISSRLYAVNNFRFEIVISHFLLPCLFIVVNMFYKRTQFFALEIVQVASLLAVIYISILNTNYYGFALVTSYAISYYFIGVTGTVQNTPAKDLLSYSLAFSNYFTVKTLEVY